MEPEPTSLTFGQRFRLLRKRTGKTQAVIGELVGKSGDWARKLEADEIHMPRLPMLLRLAEVLGVTDLAELTGDSSVPVASVTRHADPAGPAIVDAMLRPTRQRDVDPVALDVPGRLAHVLDLWQRSPAVWTTVGPLLPDLIADARAVVRALDGTARRRAYEDLALVYHAAQWQLAYGPNPETVWSAASLGMAAAEEADDPVALATAAWSAILVYQSANHLDAAETVAVEAVGQLTPDAGGNNLALWGKMHMSLAITHAHAGRAGQAWHEFDLAATAERALGRSWGPLRSEPTPYEIAFTSTAGLSAVEVEVDLCQPSAAIRRAEAVDLSMSPPSKRADVHIQVARAHRQQRDDDGILAALERAAAESVGTVGRWPFARQALLELLGKPGMRDRAIPLASAIGLIG